MEPGSGEKTEAPTARRLERARRRGEVATSRDLAGAIVFLAVFGAFTLTAVSWLAGLLVYFRLSLGQAAATPSLAAAGRRAFDAFVGALSAPVGAAVLAAILVGGLQTGWMVSSSGLRFDPARVLPDRRRVASAEMLSELGKGLVKVAVVGGGAWLAAVPLLRVIAASAGSPPVHVLSVMGGAAERIALPVGVLATAVGGLDLLWRRRRHRQRLRMTRDEVKRERKEAEGDPTHKAERQRLHRELLEQRMLDEVRRADFVVVNPDHIAAAIRYDREGPSAPRVVAKGERLVAARIREIAREAGVPIFRDVALARSVRDVRVGDEIPEALYEAVAKILRVVRLGTPGAQNSPGEATPGAAAPSPATSESDRRRV